MLKLFSLQENLLEYDLGVIPYMRFNLEDPCNLTLRKSEGSCTDKTYLLRTVEPFVHTSLDLYAFIALSPSSSTVNGLIKMVKSDNDRRQQEMDRMGCAGDRLLNVRIITISLYRVSHLFSCYSSASPASQMQNMS